MGRFTLLCVLSALVFGAISIRGGVISAEQNQSTLSQDHGGVLAGFELGEDVLSRISLFDRLVFGGKEGNYVSLKNKGYRQDKIQVAYSQETDPSNRHLRSNFNSWLTLWPFLFSQTASYDGAELFFLGIESLDHKGLNSVRPDLLSFFDGEVPSDLFSRLVVGPDQRCAVWRQVEDFYILRSIVFVTQQAPNLQSEDQEKAEVSCINRGLFYHMGFSNVMTEPERLFVTKRVGSAFGQTKLPPRFRMNSNFLPPYYDYLRSGEFAGFRRGDLLREIAERESR